MRLIAHPIVSVMNLKIYEKILPIHLQQHIMEKDSTEALNLGRYAESFCLFILCEFLGGNFQSINS